MKTIQSFLDLSEEKLLGIISSTSSKLGSQHLELAKVLCALDRQREGKGTLKKYVREKTGHEVPDHAFCCAVVFRGLVMENHLDESIYDNTPLKWLLQVSAILNLMEKQGLEESTRKVVIADVCKILIDRPDGAEGLLKKIKESLKPQAEPAAGDGDQEPEGDGGETKNFLTAAHFQEIGQALVECSDLATLQLCEKAFDALLEVAKGRLEELSTPASKAA